jgi:hypothetical protein
MKVTLLLPALFLFFVIRNHFFSFNPSSDPRASALISALFTGPLYPHHASILSFLSNIACGSNSPVYGQVWKPYRWAACPIPSLTLEESFPPTNLIGIHSWSEGCSNLEQFNPAWYWFGGG